MYTRNACSQACAAVSALLPRITSLNLSFRYHKYDPFTPWERIFTAQHTTHTLTHLTTRDILDSELLGLLISHAPSLTDLTVGSMYVDTEDYKQRQWAVRRLHIKDFLLLESQGMEMLMRLPSSSAERLCVVVDGLELVSNSDEVSVVYVCACAHIHTMSQLAILLLALNPKPGTTKQRSIR